MYKLKMSTNPQSPSNISVPTVIRSVDQLLPLLASGPFSASTLARLATLCGDMKAVGPLLDNYDKDKMDITHTILTKICQDSQLDVLLRLQVLEVIELRTLGWVSTEAVDNYYQERFAQFEEARREQVRRDAKISRSKEGEKKRKLSQTTTSMTSTQEQNYEVIVNGEKIFLNSTNPELAANAGKLLVTHLTNQSSLPSSSSPSSMKYSRTDLLTLATSPLSREAPENWDRMVSKLPTVILRSPETSRMVASASGDSSLTTSMPASLPVIRNLGN